MKTTGKQTSTIATPGFAIKIKNGTALCGRMLTAEMGVRSHEPCGLVISVNEALEIALGNMRYRMKQCERGGTPACLGRYLGWE
jgi:hypothetical protein